jgi:hypothetical protein
MIAALADADFKAGDLALIETNDEVSLDESGEEDAEEGTHESLVQTLLDPDRVLRRHSCLRSHSKEYIVTMALTTVAARKPAAKIVRRKKAAVSRELTAAKASFERALSQDSRGPALKRRMDEALKTSGATDANMKESDEKVVA